MDRHSIYPLFIIHYPLSTVHYPPFFNKNLALDAPKRVSKLSSSIDWVYFVLYRPIIGVRPGEFDILIQAQKAKPELHLVDISECLENHVAKTMGLLQQTI